MRREREEQQTRQALADLALAGRVRVARRRAARRPLHPAPAAASAVLPVGEGGAVVGVALPAGAQLVRTSLVRAVAEAIGQAMAAEGAVCVFGDPAGAIPLLCGWRSAKCPQAGR